MPCMSITINSPSAAVDLYTLLFEGSKPGYVCNPASGLNPPDPIGTVAGMVAYLSVQADPTNTAGTYVYKGDSRVSSTCKGKALGVGVIDEQSSDYNALHLREIYLLASASGVVANVEFHIGQ
jgi:hypothetical protein